MALFGAVNSEMANMVDLLGPPSCQRFQLFRELDAVDFFTRRREFIEEQLYKYPVNEGLKVVIYSPPVRSFR
jgi:hypothetical protein